MRRQERSLEHAGLGSAGATNESWGRSPHLKSHLKSQVSLTSPHHTGAGAGLALDTSTSPPDIWSTNVNILNHKSFRKFILLSRKIGMRKVFSGLWRETVIVGELIVVLKDPCSITALLLLIK